MRDLGGVDIDGLIQLVRFSYSGILDALRGVDQDHEGTCLVIHFLEVLELVLGLSPDHSRLLLLPRYVDYSRYVTGEVLYLEWISDMLKLAASEPYPPLELPQPNNIIPPVATSRIEAHDSIATTTWAATNESDLCSSSPVASGSKRLVEKQPNSFSSVLLDHEENLTASPSRQRQIARSRVNSEVLGCVNTLPSLSISRSEVSTDQVQIEGDLSKPDVRALAHTPTTVSNNVESKAAPAFFQKKDVKRELVMTTVGEGPKTIGTGPSSLETATATVSGTQEIVASSDSKSVATATATVSGTQEIVGRSDSKSVATATATVSGTQEIVASSDSKSLETATAAVSGTTQGIAASRGVDVQQTVTGTITQGDVALVESSFRDEK